ncbi:MAG TPA: polymer-forming cytoskeletal protein [Candidatus Baltobacteraceae bacterium]|nr:polymer-forming cytoskeletal protein [Candidatus Baltobacteraceae bacterium]
MKRLVGFFALVAAAFAVTMAPASASVRSVYHGGTYVGSVIVEPGQLVQGDLTVFAGDATIEGAVEGDVTVIGGNVYERPGAMIAGRVNTIGGDVASMVVPWSPAPYAATSTTDYRLLWRILWNVVVVLLFLVFPLRTRMALDRLERHPGLSTGIGLLGWVAVLPLAILLICTIVLIPFLAVEFVAVVAAVFLGTAALALLVGRRLCEVISPSTTPTPFVALIVGLALITAAELVPVIGTVVMVFVALIGLGAAILAFTGETLIGPTAGVRNSGPPLSGPPMPAG